MLNTTFTAQAQPTSRGPRPGLLASILTVGLALAGCTDEPSMPPLGEVRLGDRGPEVHALHEYLQTYGYLPSPSLGDAADHGGAADPDFFDERLEQALLRYQRAFGLPADGVLNAATLRSMRTPRCGEPDFRAGAPGANFVYFGSTWPTGNLTYSYAPSFTSDLPFANADAALSGALARWAAVAPLTFTRVWAGGDIDVGFYPAYHPAIDPHALGYAYAHAFPPPTPADNNPVNGDAHFNDEVWSWSDDGSASDLASIALHEFGHSLGLYHSFDPGAVMFPSIPIGAIRRELGSDDIEGIQTLYLRAPSSIVAASEHCRGTHEVFWSGVTAATWYELYRADSWSFTGQTLLYSGSNLSTIVNVPASTRWYLRARACNSYGCSDYTPGTTATYHSGACW